MTTQFARASYQEIIDLHTESDAVSVIGIHTPTNDTPMHMFGGFFNQFKRYKYDGCSVSLVPAARLPADPLQVSYDSGDPTIDPRDMLNPIMFHGCHGQDMGTILNRLYDPDTADITTDSIDILEQQQTSIGADGDIDGVQLEALYYKALTDNTWKKAHPQRGFRKSGLHPMVYDVNTLHQMDGVTSLNMNRAGVSIEQGVPTTPDLINIVTSGGVTNFDMRQSVDTTHQFITGRLKPLGWLDTRNVYTTPATIHGSVNTSMTDEEQDETLLHLGTTLNAEVQNDSKLPRIYMGVILMPPAYKTEQYYRMIVNHHFSFAQFRGISMANAQAETPSYFDLNRLGEGHPPNLSL